MALICCPECGKEGISSSALCCPKCGFNIEGWMIECEERREAEERESRLTELKRQRMEEHEKKLMEIPEPEPYGNVIIYILSGIAAGIFVIKSSLVLAIVPAVISGVYFLVSFVDYKRFVANPHEWRERRLKDDDTFENGDMGLICPKCGSRDIQSQIFQEAYGSTTTSHTTSKYREKGHGCLWWLLIGWWWSFLDLLSWFFLFLPRLVLRIFAMPYKKKKYTGSTNTISSTTNHIGYKTIYLCQNCGYTW